MADRNDRHPNAMTTASADRSRSLEHRLGRWKEQAWRTVHHVVRSACAWSVIGAMTGYAITFGRQVDGVELAANMIAGMIVLTPMGAFLGFLRTPARTSLIGAMVGLATALTYFELAQGSHASGQTLGVSVIIGSLIGATSTPFLRGAMTVLSRSIAVARAPFAMRNR